jgi:hypothetical protein
MARALSVLADLSLALDGEDIAIRGQGDRVIIDLPSLQAGRALFRAGPFSRHGRRAGLATLNVFLRETDLTVDVQYAGETVVRLGAQAQPNAVARLLNLGDIEVRPAKPVRAAFRRRPGLVLGVLTAAAALAAFIYFRSSGDD